jgi:hypothetical protein
MCDDAGMLSSGPLAPAALPGVGGLVDGEVIEDARTGDDDECVVDFRGVGRPVDPAA